VSVHPDFEYAKVRVEDELWWLVDDLVETVMAKAGLDDYEVVETMKGSEMLGWKYEHPFKEEVPWHQEHDEQYMHAVVTGKHVTTVQDLCTPLLVLALMTSMLDESLEFLCLYP
ncbi:MAG: hypothetical protein ACW99J_18445, partial [Candidatus Thorarchaeota archaeon]